MRGLLSLIVLAACGPSAGVARIEPSPHAFDQSLAQASRTILGGDASTIRRAMVGSVGYGGLWFEDAACAKEFSSARDIPESELDAFARCIAGLHLHPTAHHHSLQDVAVLAYGPGIEVDARMGLGSAPTVLRWIGYTGAEDRKDAPPAITPEILRSIRTDGSDDVEDAKDIAVLDGEAAKSDDHVTSGWFQVCVDHEGAANAIHPLLAHSLAAVRSFTHLIESWRFRPFVAGGQPLAACAIVYLHYPSAKMENDPPRIPVAPLDPASVGASFRKRVEGSAFIPPSDNIKMDLHDSRVHVLVGALAFCVDASGTVTKVEIVESTGIKAYDLELAARMLDWRYEPAKPGDDPKTGCGVVSFVYQQENR
ncbi:MAG TPA: TonB family protein [Kofleriaceae bacterium]|jgi:TonB family protein|nr:TonB family protein [Kofleriaceae bacterium]HTL36960.1 TonB family protein [Kofleriaceae bacterium]